MKATIYKNDDFKTIGIYVENAGVKLFQYGVTCKELYYSKTMDADCYTKQILELIQLEQMRHYYADTFYGFIGQVFEVMSLERNVARKKRGADNGIDFGEYNYKASEIEERIKAIIQTIK